MKNVSKLIILFIAVIFIAQSCHIEKRRYSKGFYIQNRSSKGGDYKTTETISETFPEDNQHNNVSNNLTSEIRKDEDEIIAVATENKNVESTQETDLPEEAIIGQNSVSNTSENYHDGKSSDEVYVYPLKFSKSVLPSNGATKRAKAILALIFIALALTVFGILFLFVQASIGIIAGILCLSFAFFALLAAMVVAIA